MRRQPAHVARVFCSERLLFKSTDAGASWSDTVSPPNQACDDIRALLLDPTEANTLYYAALNLSGFPLLSKSTDGGATWRFLSALAFEDVLAMAINPLAPNILYAGGYAFQPQRACSRALTVG